MFDSLDNTQTLFQARNARLSLDRIAERLDIDTAAGTVCWKPGIFSKPTTGEAGKMIRAERVVSFDGVQITAAELVWLAAHGELPLGPIIYLDCDTSNAAIANLAVKPLVEGVADIPYHARRTTEQAAKLNARRFPRSEIATGPHYNMIFEVITALAMSVEGVICDRRNGMEPVSIFMTGGEPCIDFDGDILIAANVVIMLADGKLPEFVVYCDGSPANIKRSNLLYAEAN